MRTKEKLFTYKRFIFGLATSFSAWLILGHPQLNEPWGTGDLTYQYAILKFFSSFPNSKSSILGVAGTPLSAITPESFFWQSILVFFEKLGFSSILLLNLFFIFGFFSLSFAFTYLLDYLKVKQVLGWGLSIFFVLGPWHFQRIPHPYLAECSALIAGLFLCLFISDNNFLQKRYYVPLVAFLGLSNPYWVAINLIIVSVFLVLHRSSHLRRIYLSLGLQILSISALTNLAWSISGKLLGYHWGNYQAQIRQSVHSEIYAGKITSLIFPSGSNLVHLFSNAREKYDQITGSNENANWMSLVSLFGLLVLVFWMITIFQNENVDTIRRNLSFLFLVLVLFFTVGGLGSIVAFGISPIIRSWNRIFFILQGIEFIALALALRDLTVSRRMRNSLLLILSLLGLTDFGPGLRLSAITDPSHAVRIHSDARWVAAQELKLGCLNTQIVPFSQFPGDPYPGDSLRSNFENYDNLLISYYGVPTNYGAVYKTTEFDTSMASRSATDLNSISPRKCVVIDNGVSRGIQNDQLIQNIKSRHSSLLLESPNKRWVLISD